MPKRDKFLFICLGISFMIILVLSYHIAEHESTCDNIKLEKLYKDRCLIPDEETAKRISDIIIEANGGFEEGWYYGSNVEFDQMTNEWKVVYIKESLDRSHFFLHDEAIVYINKDSGIITALYCAWWK